MSSIFGKLTEKRDPHQAEAEAALRQLRKSVDELHRLRILNQLALRGQDPSCKYSPEEMRERVTQIRDPAMEQRFRQEMQSLMRTIYRREPTQEEMQAGPPSGEGLGLVPALFGIAAIVAGSAWGISSITNYLSGLDQRAHGEEVQRMDWMRTIERAIKGSIAVGVLGGSAYGAYRLWKWSKSRKKAPAIAETEKAPELPPAEAEEETEEEEEI